MFARGRGGWWCFVLAGGLAPADRVTLRVTTYMPEGLAVPGFPAEFTAEHRDTRVRDLQHHPAIGAFLAAWHPGDPRTADIYLPLAGAALHYRLELLAAFCL